MVAAALIDTNILVYRFDARFPQKQAIATKLLREGLRRDSVRIPHQAVLEFMAVQTSCGSRASSSSGSSGERLKVAGRKSST